MTEIQPVIGERADEPIEVGVFKQAFGFLAQSLTITEFSFLGQASEACIGAAVGEEMGEPIGDGEVVIGVRGLAEVEEMPGAQEGFVGGQQGIVERLFPVQAGLNQSIILAEGFLVDRFARGLAYEMAEQGLGIGGRDMFREEDAIGSGRRSGWDGSFDLHPLESDAGLTPWRKGRIAITRCAPFDIARQGNR